MKIRVERANGMASTKVVPRLPYVDEPMDGELVAKVEVHNPPTGAGHSAYVKLKPFPDESK